MKKKLLLMLSLCLALLVFVSPFSCCLNNVSALSHDFISSVDPSFVSPSSFPLNLLDSSYDSIIAIQGDSSIHILTGNRLPSGVDLTFTVSIDGPRLYVTPSSGRFDDYQFDFYNGVWSSSGYTSNAQYGYCYSPSGEFSIYLSNQFFVDPVFNPEYEEVLLPFFSLDVDGFYEWIINNNKLVELPSYIVQSKLKSFLEFYKKFGSSNTFFISKIADWFSHMNIANQSLSNISALKSATDKLYQEYINYRSGTHAYWPNATKIQERNDIDTHTNNNNTTLITDDSNDSVDILILRDILRGVIAISNNINQVGSNIIQKLEQLDFTVNVTNDGGSGLTINNTLQFLFVPTFNGFSDFETDLYEKFPFIAELEDLPEIEDYLQESELQRSEVVPLLRAGASGFDSNDSGDPLKTRDDLFEFAVPSNSTFLNGSVSGLSINFASFTKLGIAIECFKGIISVLAIFGFSHWLIKFVPKLLSGFGSSD